MIINKVLYYNNLNISLLAFVCNKIYFLYTGFQARMFKTERSITAEMGRNPRLINRLRNLLGLDTSPETVIRDDKLHIGQVELDKMRSK